MTSITFHNNNPLNLLKMSSRKRDREDDVGIHQIHDKLSPSTNRRRIVFSVPKKSIGSASKAIPVVEELITTLPGNPSLRGLLPSNDRYFVKVAVDISTTVTDKEIQDAMADHQQVARLDIYYDAKMFRMQSQQQHRAVHVLDKAAKVVGVAVQQTPHDLSFIDIVKGTATAVQLLQNQAPDS